MLHIYDRNIHTYLFVQYIRVFKRCRIGNDFVSRRFTFPHIFYPWDWIEWYEDQTWLLIDSRKESWTKHNFSPIFRAFFWGDFPLDHGPKYVLQHFQFKRVNKFMRLSIFHSRKCLSLAVGCEMCLFASFSTRFCFYFFRSFFAVLTFNHSFIYELLIFSLQNECHMYTWHKFSTYFMLIVMYMWVRVRVCIVNWGM